jgi:aminopeptidase-like protein
MSVGPQGIAAWTAGIDPEAVGTEIYDLARKLYPICRSITGDGLRRTLDILGREVPLAIREVPSGTRVFDWTVPREWNIRDAYIKNAQGERVVDFQRSNLHVVNYSIPIHARMSLAELRPHLHSLPEHPDWIPYRTSYYNEQWGFCLTHRQLQSLEEGEYEVSIDASLTDGHLTYAEYFQAGESSQEVLISTHACHPSLANDNLSGLALVAVLARSLCRLSLKYSYRLIFVPTTIGSITWLSQNEERLPFVAHGLVVACVGDSGPMTYKRSRRGSAEIDRAAMHVLARSGDVHRVVDFSPWGYDERQFCSPGLDLPVGLLTRTPNGQFPEYHTSADDLDLVQPLYLGDSFRKLASILEVIELNETYVNLSPKGEPQLGRRGVYRAMGGETDVPEQQLAMLWVLNLSDGQHSLLDIAERSDLSVQVLARAAGILQATGLLTPRAAGTEAAASGTRLQARIREMGPNEPRGVQ